MIEPDPHLKIRHLVAAGTATLVAMGATGERLINSVPDGLPEAEGQQAQTWTDQSPTLPLLSERQALTEQTTSPVSATALGKTATPQVLIYSKHTGSFRPQQKPSAENLQSQGVQGPKIDTSTNHRLPTTGSEVNKFDGDPSEETRVKLHAESLSVPKNIKRVMAEYSVNSPELASGFAVREGEKTIGILTSRRGLLKSQDDHWKTDEDSNLSIDLDETLQVFGNYENDDAELGDEELDSSKVTDSVGNDTEPDDAPELADYVSDPRMLLGNITDISLPAAEDLTHDTVLAALDGVSMEKVRTEATKQQMSPEKIAALKLGDVAYMSDWYKDSENNEGRQELAMHILGIHGLTTEEGKKLQVLFTAIPKSANQKISSPDASGAGAFQVNDKNRIEYIGPLSASFNIDSEAGAAKLRELKELFKFDLDTDSYGAVYAFDISPQNGNITAKVVVPESEASADEENALSTKSPVQEALSTPVPAPRPTPEQTPLTDKQLEEAYANAFFEPTFDREVVDGYVKTIGPEGEVIWLDRPTVYRFTSPNGDKFLLSWYEQGHGLRTQVSDLQTAQELLNVYAHDDSDDKVTIQTEQGPIRVRASSNDSPTFINDKDIAFGRQLSEEPINHGVKKAFQIEDDGQIAISNTQ